MATQEKRLVFISHSSRDTWVAKQMARCIMECGAQPFLDEADVEVTDDFEEEIREFLAKAHELVVLLTPWALDRPYVWAELGAAWARQIPIVGVLHGLTPAELQTRPGIPVFLKKRNLIEINAFDRYCEELLQRSHEIGN